ncbi:hypothetical protein Tco_0613794 [Tanacetum coccineum]
MGKNEQAKSKWGSHSTSGSLPCAQECLRHLVIESLQESVYFVGHLALVLFEIGFKPGYPSVLRCHEVRHQYFDIWLIVEILRIIIEGSYARMHNQQKLARDFSCNIECRGDDHKSHMKKRFCLLERVDDEQDELPSSVGLDFELDETTIGCTRNILGQRYYLDRFSEVSWVVPTFVLMEGDVLQ